MCKLIKWNPSLLLAILPSMRYFKIERENFRVPRRGLAGKKLFDPACYLRLFICFFSLFHYYKAGQQRGKEIFGQVLHYVRTNFLTLFLKRCSWEPKVGNKFRVQLPFKVPFEPVCRSPSFRLSRAPQFFYKSIVFNYSTANDVFCKQRRILHPHQKGLQDLALATNRNTTP